jgi:hypothetical protein
MPGLRDAMFDVLENLRNGEITVKDARAQLEAAKTICLTVACERTELQIFQQQIELDEKLGRLEDKRRTIEHVQ